VSGQPQVRADVAAALAAGGPVVALESTIVSHGLPRPRNLEVARDVERIVTEEGAIAATIGVLAGTPVIGLDTDGLERLATAQDVRKLSARDLPLAAAHGLDGATTVAATAVLAATAGIRVFATGGLGGVHRDARDTWDESADLTALSRSAITVVCSGVKSILDVGATLERLETLGVAVAGYRSTAFPGFYLRESGHVLDWSLDSPDQVAAVMGAQRSIGGPAHALVVANALGSEEEMDPALHDRVLADGLRLLGERGITGQDVTPFLLAHFHEATGGASLEANVRLIRRNAALAARIAVAAARGTDGPVAGVA
jgi:pseudouridylate synthase